MKPMVSFMSDGDLLDHIAEHGLALTHDELGACMAMVHSVFRTGRLTRDERERAERILARLDPIACRVEPRP